MPEELDIPDAVHNDPDAFELLRVWAADGEQHVTISAQLRGEAADFGVLIADLVQHGARLYSQREGLTVRNALELILSGIRKELKEQTHGVTGSIGHDA